MLHDFHRWPGSPALILYSLSRPLRAAENAPFAGLTQVSAEQFMAAILAARPRTPSPTSRLEAAQARVAQAVALDDPTLSYAFAPETLGDSEGDFSQTADHEAAAVRYEQEGSSAEADEYRKAIEWY